MDFTIRELQEADIENGLLETLENLYDDTEEMDPVQIKEILGERSDANVLTLVALTQENQVIGTVSLILERKFAHGGAYAGHLEDCITRKGYEGQGVGKALVAAIINKAREHGCYKVILDCDQKNMGFYAKNGFKPKEQQMRLDL